MERRVLNLPNLKSQFVISSFSIQRVQLKNGRSLDDLAAKKQKKIGRRLLSQCTGEASNF